MRKLYFCCILVLLASTVFAQKINFIEQVGAGYSSGVQANTFSPAGNTGGFSFGSTGDFLLHNLVGLGLGFDINIIKMNNINQSLTPVFADFKIIGRGKFRPYLVVDPGYCFYYNSTGDGAIQKASFYMGGGAGVWFPSKGLLHLFLQAKYNYTAVTTSANGYPASSAGSLQTFGIVAGYKF